MANNEHEFFAACCHSNDLEVASLVARASVMTFLSYLKVDFANEQI